MRAFSAARGGDVVARLDPAEAGIVGLLLDQLEQLLEADADDVGDDPVIARLLPDGHRGDPEAAAWLRATNDLRLALGTRLDITDDTEPPEEITGEEDQQLAVYYWLTALQGSLVDALVAGRGARS